jgi:uncharacterized delta-60 repeat protein
MKKITLLHIKQSFVCCFFFVTYSYSQDGSLDISFDSDGKVTTDFGTLDYGYSTAIQNDGKIIVAGSSGNSFALARYNSNGSLDTSFDTDGKTTVNFGTNEDYGQSVVIQNDQKIIVAGTTTFVGLNTDFAVARFNTDGTLDNTFGVGGKVVTTVGGEDRAYQVALQSDSKIVVVGTSNLASDYGYSLVRYNSNGTLDTSFDGDGKILIDLFFDINRDAFALAIQNDGKIVIGGVSDENFALLRFNGNGSLDTTFDVDGKVTTDIGNLDVIYAIAIQSDGKIVVTGATRTSLTSSDLVVARYTTNGSLDTSFGSLGKVIFDFGTSAEGASVVLQSDGKIVVGGIIDTDFLLLRYNSNGTIDATFDTDGKVITNFGGDDGAVSIKLQTNGKIVAAGFSNDDFALARYTNGTLSTQDFTTFNAGTTIFPNPFVYSTTITTKQVMNNASLKIYNSIGQCIKEIHSIYSDSVEISIENATSGMYFISIENEGTITTEKIIKE